MQRIDRVRETKKLAYLRTDGKTQVTVQYKNGKPVGVTMLVIAVPHEESIPLEKVKKDIRQKVVQPVLAKVDRSGAYAARFIAKNIVAHNLADVAEVRLAYFIGAKKPIMQEVETFGAEKVSKKAITDFSRKILDTSVAGILSILDLQRPIYLPTACYGHFGRDEFP